MAERCRACSLSQARLAELDGHLVDRDLTLVELSKLYGITEPSIRRHRNNHLPEAFMVPTDPASVEVRQRVPALADLEDLLSRSKSLMVAARRSRSIPKELQAIRETRATIELKARIEGDLNDRPQVNLLMLPEWITVRELVMTTLEPFPDARAAVAGKLLELEAARAGSSSE